MYTNKIYIYRLHYSFTIFYPESERFLKFFSCIEKEIMQSVICDFDFLNVSKS